MIPPQYMHKQLSSHLKHIICFNNWPNITSIKTSSDSESHSDPLRFSRKSPHWYSLSPWLRWFNPFFATFKTLAPRSLPRFFRGRRTPLNFRKNQGWCAFFHVDCGGEVRFSPHLKKGACRAFQNMRAEGTPLDFYENHSIDSFCTLITMVQSFFATFKTFEYRSLQIFFFFFLVKGPP